MNGYQIINLTSSSLARGKQSSADSYEEKLKGDASGVFDASGHQNLILKCVDCGDLLSDAAGECDACGGTRFHVSRLARRQHASLSDFAFRVTGKAPQNFLHINSAQATQNGAKIYYTTNGSDPSESSLLYKHPVSVESNWSEVRAIAIAPAFYSQIISQRLKTSSSEPSRPVPPPIESTATDASDIRPPSRPTPLPPPPKPVPPPSDKKEEEGCGCFLVWIILFIVKIVLIVFS